MMLRLFIFCQYGSMVGNAALHPLTVLLLAHMLSFPHNELLKRSFCPQKSHHKSDIGSIFSIISCHIK